MSGLGKRWNRGRAPRSLWAGLCALLSLLWATKEATAQYVPYGPFEVYPGQTFKEGPGFKVFGDGLVLHPGVSSELGYDSNVMMSATSSHAGVFRLRAHVDLATLPPQRLDGSRPTLEFRVGAAIEYRQYFSANSLIGSAQQFNASSDAQLTLFGGRPLSIFAFNHFLVTNDARNLEVANRDTFAPRIYDRLGLLATYRPWNGPLEIGLGESFRVDHFVQSGLAAFNSVANDLSLYGQLAVLPETLVKLELRSSYIKYYGATTPMIPSAPLRVIGGVQSMLTRWLGASLYLGYGNSLHHGFDSTTPAGFVGTIQSASDLRTSTFIGGLEGRLRMFQRVRLSAGWARDFFDSLFASYFVDDRLYIHYEHGLWRSLVVKAQFETYIRQYGGLVRPSSLGYLAYQNGATTRSDVLVAFQAGATYQLLRFLQLGVNYSVLGDITNFGFVDGAGTRNDAAFTKHVLLFQADLAY